MNHRRQRRSGRDTGSGEVLQKLDANLNGGPPTRNRAPRQTEAHFGDNAFKQIPPLFFGGHGATTGTGRPETYLVQLAGLQSV